MGAHLRRKLPVQVFQATANWEADVQSSTSRMRVLLCLSHLALPARGRAWDQRGQV